MQSYTSHPEWNFGNVASLFRSARLFTWSEFHSTSLLVKRHSTFHKQISPLSPCQGASYFLREANFITSPPLSKRFGFSTQSEFHPPSAKGRPTFNAKRVSPPPSPYQGAFNFPREASSLHLPLSQRAHDLLRKVSSTSPSSCFKTRGFPRSKV